MDMTLRITVDPIKLKAANEALSLFAPGTTIERQPGRGIVVIWTGGNGKKFTRRWQGSSGNEGRPTWFGSYPYNGTVKSALVQLVLWLRGKPVLRLSFWQHWTSDDFGIGRDVPEILKAAGYPVESICLNCKRLIQPNVDWCGRGAKKGVKCVSAIQ